MCHVHLIRQAPKKVPKKKHKEVSEKIKEALVDRQKLQDLIRELDNMRYKSTADTLEHFQYDVMNYMQFPQSHWKRIRTPNIMERTNKEIKRIWTFQPRNTFQILEFQKEIHGTEALMELKL
ncbi:hypothetical protein A9239_10980 [Methanosarcina sp. A14]|uniref:Mobile element protein n=2 Tax=Methanosarcina barkeri TaxID=2208 RepID=A0A0E3QVG0_METBA|nr:Mobile element protein [Methanosarcina barkeri MS]AKJ37719.1 transposase [Methanosarcina barkeri CM1]OED06801.1 hypothetical protein A9239_10980 [Methanosarcina sp. A14]